GSYSPISRVAISVSAIREQPVLSVVGRRGSEARPGQPVAVEVVCIAGRRDVVLSHLREASRKIVGVVVRNARSLDRLDLAVNPALGVIGEARRATRDSDCVQAASGVVS